MLAIIAGRAFRFLLEGYFAVRYGAEAKVILAKYYPWIGIGVVAVIIAVVIVRRILKRGQADAAEQSLEISSGN
jgi:mannose/fructose/N-acetylgalactosamine-specific phosphotransferase system component IIC